MRLLIVAATEEEIKPFLSRGGFGHPQCSVLITGVGMVATAYRLGAYLASHPVDAIMNVGIAGSFEYDLPLGSVVRVASDAFSELGAENGKEFLDIDQLGFGTQRFAENTVGLNKLGTLDSLRQVRGITVNTVHGNLYSISRIYERMQPEVESMEGAAVFYCAEQMNIPCVQVRSISNRVETRDTAAWMIPLAIEKLNKWLMAFCEEFFFSEDS